MTRPRNTYTLYKRDKKKLGDKAVYYVRFRMPDGTRSPGMSTGETAKVRARKFADDYLKKNKGIIVRNSGTKLEDYARGFFDYDGEWATDKRLDGGSVSERYCMALADVMRLHVIPALGKYPLQKIDTQLLKIFRNELVSDKGYSAAVASRALSAISTILKDAEARELIAAAPAIPKAKGKSKAKGMLTIDEVKNLFSVEWESLTGFTGNLLAASTGLRLGELQGIRLENLQLDGGYIIIDRSWDNRCNKLNETTKTGKSRNIFIPEKVVKAIQALLQIHPAQGNMEAFLFFGVRNAVTVKPAEKRIFLRSLYQAMEKIGISEEERKQRNVTFHSWRYFLNSLLINSKIPLQKVQSITGHSTAEMTQHYYGLDDMQDVRAVQENIFH